MTIMSSLVTPRSRISLTARLSAAPSSTIPTTVYSVLCSVGFAPSEAISGTSRPPSKLLPPPVSTEDLWLSGHNRAGHLFRRAPAYSLAFRCTSPTRISPVSLSHYSSTTIKVAVKERLYRSPQTAKISSMDIRNQQKLSDRDARPLDEHYEEPGLGAWVKRNSWLLVRLFVVMVFTFGASTTAANFSYGLEGEPITLS